MEFFEIMDYVFWLPIIFWGLVYIWFWRCSFPLYLRKMVKKGNKWAVVPEGYSGSQSGVARLRVLNVVFTLVASVALSLTCCWVLRKFGVDTIWGFTAMLPGILLAIVLYKIAMGRISVMYHSAYFLEYRKVRYESEIKGNFRSEADVHNRTVWSFTKKLKNAEAHGRLWKYVNAMAKTKKIPPDVYAETMYV